MSFRRLIGLACALTLIAGPACTAQEAEPNERTVTVALDSGQLVGTLRVPAGTGPFPGVVIVSGSGPQDRDGTIAGHPVNAALSEGLARAGIASLRLDDRGVGESAAPTPNSPLDLADDAHAALEVLAAQPEISCAGFAGHSEGGLIALLAAPAASPDFVVSLAGLHLTMEETLLGQSEAIILAAGGTRQQVAANRALQDAMFAVLLNATPDTDLVGEITHALVAAGLPETAANQQAALWGRPYAVASFQIDPDAAARAYDGPVLAIFAERDTQVLLEPSRTALSQARTGLLTQIIVIDGVNHLFQETETGLPTEYASSPHPMAPRAVQTISEAVSNLAQTACQN